MATSRETKREPSGRWSAFATLAAARKTERQPGCGWRATATLAAASYRNTGCVTFRPSTNIELEKLKISAARKHIGAPLYILRSYVLLGCIRNG